jgi:RNA polymerase sigma-70 factor (ECF subfamily)
MKVVRNRALDALRHDAAARRPELAELDEVGAQRDRSSDSPEESVIARNDNDAMLAALRRLPDAQAAVIMLAFFGELTHTEIAAQLALPEGTVKGRMRLGLKKLRVQLDDGETAVEQSG